MQAGIQGGASARNRVLPDLPNAPGVLMNKITLSASAAAVLCFTLSGAQAADFEEMTLRLAHTAAVTHAHHQACEQFARNVSERTDGMVNIEVYPAGELGDQPSLAEQITTGSLDMAVVSLGNLAVYEKKLNAMTAPFLFESYDEAHKVIDGFVMGWMNEGLINHDSYALSMFDYGFRQTTTKGIEVKSAADLKGVKIRVPPATGLVAGFEAIGADTTEIPYSELYSSLKQGLVAGQENPVSTIWADALYEIQDNLALTSHYFDCQGLIISTQAFDGMSEELQAIIKEEAIKAQNLTRELIAGGEAKTIEDLKAKGMTVTAPDRKSFVDLMKPAYDRVGELAGHDEMQKLLDAVAAAK